MSAQQINIPKLGLFLGLVAAIASGLLSIVYASTKEGIANNQQKKINAALEQVLPAFDNVPGEELIEIASKENQFIRFYIARKNGALVGFAGVGAREGFSGLVEVMAGLDIDGSVRKVIVTQQTETPGLGTAITDRKIRKTILDLINGAAETAGLPPNAYLDQYDGRKGEGTAWAVVKDGGDVDAKTGATVTSRAVCGAVYAVSATCVEHLDELGK